MSKSMTYNRSQKLREVAILVASVDSQWAERLLTSLPEEDAAEVREIVEHLGPLDAIEQQEIVAKFQQNTETQRSPQAEGVELDASLLARFEEQELEEFKTPPAAKQELLETLNDSEMETVVDMLAAEHPQTIAIVLSRLSPTSSAGLLSKFPPTVQADVLVRMANHHTADEQTVQVVESQLAMWIDQHRQQRQRMAAGLELVESILASTPEAQRKTVLTHLNGKDPNLAGRLTKTSNRVSDAYRGNFGVESKVKEPAVIPMPRPRITAPPAVVAAPPIAEPRPTPPRKVPSVQPSLELDQLDDATLLAALNRTDREVVTLALAGASEDLLKRVLRGLPRRQARMMQRQLRDIGPTRLSDMLAAQQTLLANANQQIS